jgi:hypothetical protein
MLVCIFPRLVSDIAAVQAVSLIHDIRYTYLANSPWVEQIQFKQGSNVRMTTKSYNVTATVNVNGEPAARHGTYYRGRAQAANGPGPVWLSVTNQAVQQDGTSPDKVRTETGSVFVPPSQEVFGHDFDGNLTSDGRWIYY